MAEVLEPGENAESNISEAILPLLEEDFELEGLKVLEYSNSYLVQSQGFNLELGPNSVRVNKYKPEEIGREQFKFLKRLMDSYDIDRIPATNNSSY